MNFKHGHKSQGKPTLTYTTWRNMLQRCTDPKHSRFNRYGGRGIVVCDRWLVFTNFLHDMDERPKGLTLDRIDNDGNYELDNCRWATYCEQNQNNTSTKLTWKGVRSIRELVKRKCPVTQKRLAEWFGVHKTTISLIVTGKTWQESFC